MLRAGNPGQAQGPFREALSRDQTVMGKLGPVPASFFKRRIEEDMARTCYLQGRSWSSRKDPVRACQLWRMGFAFSKSNPQLNRAVADCSHAGRRLLARAKSCDQLTRALQFARPRACRRSRQIADARYRRRGAQRAQLHRPQRAETVSSRTGPVGRRNRTARAHPSSVDRLPRRGPGDYRAGAAARDRAG